MFTFRIRMVALPPNVIAFSYWPPAENGSIGQIEGSKQSYNYKYQHTPRNRERDQRQITAPRERHQEDPHWGTKTKAPRRPFQDFQPFLERNQRLNPWLLHFKINKDSSTSFTKKPAKLNLCSRILPWELSLEEILLTLILLLVWNPHLLLLPT